MSMSYVRGKTFKNDVVPLDGTHFIKCQFVGCTMIYSGGDWSWTECKFEECTINLQGAAQRTAAFLKHIEQAMGGIGTQSKPPKSAPN